MKKSRSSGEDEDLGFGYAELQETLSRQLDRQAWRLGDVGIGD